MSHLTSLSLDHLEIRPFYGVLLTHSLHRRVLVLKALRFSHFHEYQCTTVPPEVASRIDAAFHQYRDRTLASNRAYLRDLATVLEGRNYPSSRAMRKWLNTVPELKYKNRTYETPRELADQTPDEDLDGVYLPPVSEEKRQQFFRLLHEKVNEYIREQEGDDAQPVGLPEEYMALLQHCDALQDPNLCVTDIGGLCGTWCIWPDDEKDCFHIDMPVEEAIGMVDLVDSNGGWEFKTAFMIDCNVEMFCGYGYCRWRRDFTPVPGKWVLKTDVTEQDFEWKWRIFYDGCFATRSFVSPYVEIFNSLVEYLDWLSSWYDREFQGDISKAAQQIKKPPYLQGVTESRDFSDENGDGFE